MDFPRLAWVVINPMIKNPIAPINAKMRVIIFPVVASPNTSPIELFDDELLLDELDEFDEPDELDEELDELLPLFVDVPDVGVGVTVL
jgi:hypothetical protein